MKSPKCADWGCVEGMADMHGQWDASLRAEEHRPSIDSGSEGRTNAVASYPSQAEMRRGEGRADQWQRVAEYSTSSDDYPWRRGKAGGQE